jgi:mono/diheme cytochrome c family protein
MYWQTTGIHARRSAVVDGDGASAKAASRSRRGVISMPSFGAIFSDTEIAAVANYITARFSSEPSKLTETAVAQLRKQTPR